MRVKNFAGKLKFSHDDHRLDITVLHNDAGKTKKSQMSDMKQLSGGERSFTQVALLMSLGKCCTTSHLFIKYNVEYNR